MESNLISTCIGGNGRLVTFLCVSLCVRLHVKSLLFGNDRVREREVLVRGGTSHTRCVSLSDVVTGVSTSSRVVARLELIPPPERGHVLSFSLTLSLCVLALIMGVYKFVKESLNLFII